MTGAPLTSDHVNYLIWRYLQERGFGKSAVQLSREWGTDDPHQLPFAHSVKQGTLISILQDGLRYDALAAAAEFSLSKGKKPQRYQEPVVNGTTTPTHSSPLPGLRYGFVNERKRRVDQSPPGAPASLSNSLNLPRKRQRIHNDDAVATPFLPASQIPSKTAPVSPPSASSPVAPSHQRRRSSKAPTLSVRTNGEPMDVDDGADEAPKEPEPDAQQAEIEVKEEPQPIVSTLEIGETSGTQKSREKPKEIPIATTLVNKQLSGKDILGAYWDPSDPGSLVVTGGSTWQSIKVPAVPSTERPQSRGNSTHISQDPANNSTKYFVSAIALAKRRQFLAAATEISFDDDASISLDLQDLGNTGKRSRMLSPNHPDCVVQLEWNRLETALLANTDRQDHNDIYIWYLDDLERDVDHRDQGEDENEPSNTSRPQLLHTTSRVFNAVWLGSRVPDIEQEDPKCGAHHFAIFRAPANLGLYKFYDKQPRLRAYSNDRNGSTGEDTADPVVVRPQHVRRVKCIADLNTTHPFELAVYDPRSDRLAFASIETGMLGLVDTAGQDLSIKQGHESAITGLLWRPEPIDDKPRLEEDSAPRPENLAEDAPNGEVARPKSVDQKGKGEGEGEQKRSTPEIPSNAAATVPEAEETAESRNETNFHNDADQTKEATTEAPHESHADGEVIAEDHHNINEQNQDNAPSASQPTMIAETSNANPQDVPTATHTAQDSPTNPTLLATSALDGTIKLWSTHSTALECVGNLFMGVLTPCAAIAFSPNGKLLAGAGDGCVYVWRVADDLGQISNGQSDAQISMQGIENAEPSRGQGDDMQGVEQPDRNAVNGDHSPQRASAQETFYQRELREERERRRPKEGQLVYRWVSREQELEVDDGRDESPRENGHPETQPEAADEVRGEQEPPSEQAGTEMRDAEAQTNGQNDRPNEELNEAEVRPENGSENADSNANGESRPRIQDNETHTEEPGTRTENAPGQQDEAQEHQENRDQDQSTSTAQPAPPAVAATLPAQPNGDQQTTEAPSQDAAESQSSDADQPGQPPQSNDADRLSQPPQPQLDGPSDPIHPIRDAPPLSTSARSEGEDEPEEAPVTSLLWDPSGRMLAYTCGDRVTVLDLPLEEEEGEKDEVGVDEVPAAEGVSPPEEAPVPKDVTAPKAAPSPQELPNPPDESSNLDKSEDHEPPSPEKEPSEPDAEGDREEPLDSGNQEMLRSIGEPIVEERTNDGAARQWLGGTSYF